MSEAAPDDPLSVAARRAFVLPCNAVIKLAPETGAPLFVDARRDPPVISGALPDGCREADCEWRAAADILTRVLGSNRAVENAVINGRLAIAGDMSVMARLTIDAKT